MSWNQENWRDINWVVVWQDNFDGTELDRSKWKPEVYVGEEAVMSANVILTVLIMSK